jgi:putative ABC transport system ATP-binding protein
VIVLLLAIKEQMKAKTPPLIQLSKLTRIYQGEGVKTVALTKVDLSISDGEFISIMGPSGSGKSTLLHLIGLLDRPTSGQYHLDNNDTSKLTDIELAHLRNKQIGFIFQSFHLLSRATVLENVMLPLYYSNLPTKKHKERALIALEEVSMTHRLDHQPSQLSGGEKQRVAIARALVNQPKIILADEPTGNLDSRTGESVLQTIDSLHKQGHTIIVITHETPTAQYAQRIITMLDGELDSDKAVSLSHKHDSK